MTMTLASEETSKQDHKYDCPICGNHAWKNVDQYRTKAVGMSLCAICGFITYPELCSKPLDVTEFYREDYRNAPTYDNILTGERKLHYHAEFLREIILGWQEKKESPKILEVGAAFGMVLKWFKTQLPNAEIYGTELTKSFVRNAFHLPGYGFNLTEKPDYTKKYDLIVSYKVAEHIPSPASDLRKLVECLNDGGLMYISVPVWFKEMKTFGAEGWNIESYYDTNHVNVWSQNLFEQLLKKSGLEIVKQNHKMYDSTYLCKRNDSLMSERLVFDNHEERLAQLAAIKRANDYYLEQRFEDAINAWPCFPEAYSTWYESTRSKVHALGYDEIREKYIERAIKACPDSASVRCFGADVSLRYERHQQALDYANDALSIRPNDLVALDLIQKTFTDLSSKVPEDQRQRALQETRNVCIGICNVSQAMRPNAMTWMMQANARLRTPFEK